MADQCKRCELQVTACAHAVMLIVLGEVFARSKGGNQYPEANTLSYLHY